MSDWQDISSAPKDGTSVLLGRFVENCPHKRGGFTCVDYWRNPKGRKGYLGWGNFNSEYWPATHWQPLPEPPEAT